MEKQPVQPLIFDKNTAKFFPGRKQNLHPRNKKKDAQCASLVWVLG
jgi:hypothetical protein